jgi:hypothetical protein
MPWRCVLCVIASVACVGIAIFVFANVPWDTRMPYGGKYNRGGTGIPMQIAMLPVMVPIVGFWKTVRKPTTHHMGKAARARAYVLVTAFIGACVFFQWIFAESILTAGGYFAE